MTDRFWNSIDKNGPIPSHCPDIGQCWSWFASLDKDGYGTISVGARGAGHAFAHRVSWTLHNGPPPADKPCVLHKCDNPSCVNPSHLWVGTRADNNKDCAVKGRKANCKLDDDDVRLIKYLRIGGTRIAVIREIFGVSKATAEQAASGRTWTHVTGGVGT